MSKIREYWILKIKHRKQRIVYKVIVVGENLVQLETEKFDMATKKKKIHSGKIISRKGNKRSNYEKHAMCLSPYRLL